MDNLKFFKIDISNHYINREAAEKKANMEKYEHMMNRILDAKKKDEVIIIWTLTNNNFLLIKIKIKEGNIT